MTLPESTRQHTGVTPRLVPRLHEQALLAASELEQRTAACAALEPGPGLDPSVVARCLRALTRCRELLEAQARAPLTRCSAESPSAAVPDFPTLRHDLLGPLSTLVTTLELLDELGVRSEGRPLRDTPWFELRAAVLGQVALLARSCERERLKHTLQDAPASPAGAQVEAALAQHAADLQALGVTWAPQATGMALPSCNAALGVALGRVIMLLLSMEHHLVESRWRALLALEARTLRCALEGTGPCLGTPTTPSQWLDGASPRIVRQGDELWEVARDLLEGLGGSLTWAAPAAPAPLTITLTLPLAATPAPEQETGGTSL